MFVPLLSDSLRDLCHTVASPRVTARWTEIPPRLSWRSERCGDASKRGARPISHDERSPAKLASPDVAWRRTSIRGNLTYTFMTGRAFATSVWLTLGTDTCGQHRFTLGSVSLLLRRAQSGLQCGGFRGSQTSLFRLSVCPDTTPPVRQPRMVCAG